MASSSYDQDYDDHDDYYDAADIPTLDSMRADVIDSYRNRGCPPGYCWDFFDGETCDGSCGYKHTRPPPRTPTAQERTPKKRKTQEDQAASSEQALADGNIPLDEQAKALLEAGKEDALNPAQAKAFLKRHACACSGTKAELIQRCKKFKDLHGHAQTLYPRTSFSQPVAEATALDKDDVVLFKQKLWEGYPSRCIGDRWVAGRVTAIPDATNPNAFVCLEVYWAEGVRELSTMTTLKVKAHNIWRKDRYNDWPMPKRFVESPPVVVD